MLFPSEIICPNETFPLKVATGKRWFIYYTFLNYCSSLHSHHLGGWVILAANPFQGCCCCSNRFEILETCSQNHFIFF